MDEYKRRRRRSRAVMSMFLDSLGGSIYNVDVATFDSDGGDLKALVVGIEPVQSGTGDPSPDNVRPITGHSSVNVIVSPTLNPLDGTITNIPLGTTVYGGTLDVLTGVLTITHAFAQFDGTENWNQTANYCYVFNYPPSYAQGGSTQIGSHFSTQFVYNAGNSLFAQQNGAVVKSNRRDRDAWKAELAQQAADGTPVQLCYEIATPITIQLTGQQIATFLGTNNVWCDSGKIIHLEY